MTTFLLICDTRNKKTYFRIACFYEKSVSAVRPFVSKSIQLSFFSGRGEFDPGEKLNEEFPPLRKINEKKLTCACKNATV